MKKTTVIPLTGNKSLKARVPAKKNLLPGKGSEDPVQEVGFPDVEIGASSWRLEVFELFFKSTPPDRGVGLHLSNEILSITSIAIRKTGTPGEGAWFGMAVPMGGAQTYGKTG